jgi:hypothetical protein
MSKSKTKVRISLAFFDENYDDERFRLRYSGSLKKWAPLTELDYAPRGSTPLLDATASMIHHLGERLADDEIQVGILIDESGSMGGRQSAVAEGVNGYVDALTAVDAVDPATAGKAIVVIVTDGHENASREYSADAVSELVREREARGWTFIYLGANQDAWATGSTLGLSGGVTGQSVNFTSTSTGVQSALRSVATDTVDYLSDATAYASARAGSSNRTIDEDGDES